MLSALSFTEISYLLAALFGIAFLAVVLIRRPDKTWGLVTSIWQATGIVLLVLSVLGFTNAWRFLWIPNRLFDLNQLVFPDLNGVWEGAVLSNAPVLVVREESDIVKPRMGDACKDMKVENVPDPSPYLCQDVKVEVVMDFYRAHVLLFAPAKSKTESVELRRKSKNSREPSVLYHYVSQDGGAPFWGAAALVVHAGKPPIMEGTYWTNRNWHKGRNTAGHIRLTRVSN